MKLFTRPAHQPLTAIAFSAAAVAVSWSAWAALSGGGPGALRIEDIVLAAALAGGFILSSLFPIHLRYHTKLEITTPQLFLMAFLLPPALATLTVAAATLLSAKLTARQRGNTRSDNATAVGRWVLIVWLGSSVANLPALQGAGLAAALAATAAVMLAGDVLSAAFEISPMSGEPPYTSWLLFSERQSRSSSSNICSDSWVRSSPLVRFGPSR